MCCKQNSSTESSYHWVVVLTFLFWTFILSCLQHSYLPEEENALSLWPLGQGPPARHHRGQCQHTQDAQRSHGYLGQRRGVNQAGNLENQLSPCALRIYKTPKHKAREVFIVTRNMSLGKMPKTSWSEGRCSRIRIAMDSEFPPSPTSKLGGINPPQISFGWVWLLSSLYGLGTVC